MNKKILINLFENRDLFVPLIFTEKQFSVLKKYCDNSPLSNADKKALYTSIKKKMSALESLMRNDENKDYFINGSSEIIPERLFEAKKIVDSYSKKYDRVFVSGSFLFSKEFNDIDVLIVTKNGYKEKFEENKHIVFLSEKKLTSPVFQSASLISIANFILPNKIKNKRIKLSEAMSIYHEAVIELIRKEEKPEMIRNLIFSHSLFCKNALLNGKELKEKINNLKLSEVDFMMKELCRKLFSRTYLYVELHSYIKTLDDSIKNISSHEHLRRFKTTYEEMIYGGNEAEAY
jgi:hypothetical protein